MAKILVVPPHLYRALKTANEGEAVYGLVHAHVNVQGGSCEIVSQGKKPIRCRVALAKMKSERRKTTASVAVILRK